MSLKEPLFNVAHIKLCTEAEGPFKRCCVWFQGCTLNCRGCINKDLQELKVNHLMAISELLSVISEAKDKFDIEGVTFTGGEPLLQQFLPELCQEIRKLNLGIILFTGYKEDRIPKIMKESCDLALAGPYLYEQYDDERFLLGSKNKQIIEYTQRYHDQLSWYNMENHPIDGEICIDNENSLFFNGN